MNSAFRLGYAECRETLLHRLAEPAPGRIQLLAGPRQVGKTTLLLDLAAALGSRARYAALDSPDLAVPGAWERLWAGAGAEARAEAPAVLLLDEVQHVSGWASRLKAEWDRLRRRRVPVHVVASGSSSLRLARGSRESLAGRFERITLPHWSATALAQAFRIAPEDAADEMVRGGGYPGAFPLRADGPRWLAYVRDAIVEPAIGRDVLALADVRRPALLRQLFAVAAASPAQIVSLQKLQGWLDDPGALATLAHYLRLLEEAFLVAALGKHAGREIRRRAAPPKLIALSNALLAAADPRGIPTRDREPARFGAWVENACLAHAWNTGHRVAYWREEPLEVDAVCDGPWGRVALEVTTGEVTSVGLRGLHTFVGRWRDYRPLLVCEPSELPAAARLGTPAVDWRTFLISGPLAIPR